ncbi:hypothetical protein [Azotobacter chroococcum]|uniref:hypothetical protein n=1 Tax=Azotobacter chroococcum TaxID=353 RepID=UPI0012FDEC3D|nr:hypothetical protein [Azotobacter chroococcum]
MSKYSIPDGARFVPIKFANRAGEINDLPPGRPVVLAALRHDPEHGSGPRTISGYKAVYALVDTGADNNYATPELIQQAGCPQIGSGSIRSANSWMGSTHHLAHIFFPEAGSQFETDIFSAPLTDSESTGQNLVIGVLVIKMGRLVMDFKNHIYRLYVD